MIMNEEPNIAFEWLEDANGNRASINYFGTKEEAQAALDSLKNCKNTTNCSYCSYCSYCSRCSYCSYCSRCSDCSGCSGCSDCSDCSGCSDCSYCSDCSRCSNVAKSYDKKDVDAVGSGWTGPPPIPKIENIDAAIYAAASQPNALNMADVHACNTTHCRAGWAVHLAGDAGYELEKFFGWELAAMLIHRESGSPISPVRFYEDDETALADMRKRAGVAA